ncbi:MAG TPA: P-loop NTPase [Thermoanaerobaculia bacterium]|nr:P-loop NTPase [Thermoanaerobaculia bacterium]
MKRIVTVSSGKGGVGKTTFAVNFALSLATAAPTILVDLDTGTSSVRNSIDAPVDKDLYHFFRKDAPLTECVTRLPASLDPTGRYRDFGFVAGPRHMIEDITNFGEAARAKLIGAINRLPATYVVVDLKAGLDANVIDFLPYSNSGILIFTPELPAATLAASDIVKAILFRKLRILFAPGSPVYDRAALSSHDPRMISELLDAVEDVYDDSIPNIDAFLEDLGGSLGDDPLVDLLRESVEDFRVYYVLNMFNGVRESYETAIEPFVSNLVENVSARLPVTNLGWIVRHDRIHEANRRRCPVLLSPDPEPAPPPAPTAAELEIQALERSFLRLEPETRASAPPRPRFRPADPARALDRQLEALRAMYADQRESGVRENFSYITHRALHLMESVRTSEFGETRICSREEILAHLLPRSEATG